MKKLILIFLIFSVFFYFPFEINAESEKDKINRILKQSNEEWKYASIDYSEWMNLNLKEKRMIIGAYLAGYNHWSDIFVEKFNISKEEYDKIIERFAPLAFCVGRKGGSVDRIINHIELVYKEPDAKWRAAEFIALEYMNMLYKKCESELSGKN